MNPFIKKEIRLLLPSWLAVLSLAALLPWLAGNDPDASFAWMPFFIFFGMVLLAVDSFGREFSLGTFSALMSQPMERRQIWRTKITILALAAALIFIVFFINSGLVFHRALEIPIWAVNPKLLGADFRDGMFGSFAAVLIALAGGLWTTLLIRQAAAAFWITFLAPLGLLMLVIFFLPAKFPENLLALLLYGLAGIYVVAGCWLAHRLFHRAQDAAWTGGVISFSTWRYFEGGAKNSISTRQRRPVSALLKKEFQLHSISLLCAGALLALHIVVIAMRAFYGQTLNDAAHRDSLMAVLSEFFWTFWLVMPLVIGCMTVAEERKLGVMDGQFCQPVSRRLQFIIKFIPAMFFGVLLGGVMPLLLEFVAAKCGAPTDYLRPENHLETFSFGPGIVLFRASIIALAAGLSFVGFFASTLAKSFLQALSIAIVISVACFFGNMLLFSDRHVVADQFVFGNVRFGGVLLTFSIAILSGLVFLPCLAYRNFSRFVEIGQVWRRNIFSLAGVLLFVIISSRVIYDRAWEVFEPVEPAHGAPKLSQANPPTLRLETYQNLLVRLPDGRVWFDYLTSRDDVDFTPYESVQSFQSFKRRLLWLISNPLPRGAGPQKFIQGSNWVDATARHVDVFFGENDTESSLAFGYAESIGIQSNGTLWVSEKSDPNIWTADKLAQLGDETNWQQLARAYPIFSVLLLKKDGTLWYLGANHFDWEKWPQAWPGLRAFKPYQIGTNSDWSEISGADVYGYLLKKADGTVSRVFFNQKAQKPVVGQDLFANEFPSPKTAFDQTFGLGVRIHNDGTLWIFALFTSESLRHAEKPGNMPKWRMGTDTNWVSAVITQRWMVALKSDGTLWEDSYDGYSGDQLVRGPQSPLLPTRLGIHDDWIAITGAENGVISLAADGSLWFWPARRSYIYDYQSTLLRLPKQPKFLGNVFGGEN